MFDDLAVIDAKQIVVVRRATFRIGLDQSEDEIPVGDIAPGIQYRHARWFRDICDTRLQSSDTVAHL